MSDPLSGRMTIWISTAALILVQVLCTVFVIDNMLTNRRKGDDILAMAAENHRLLLENRAIFSRCMKGPADANGS